MPRCLTTVVLLLAGLPLASCVSVPPPPENMGVHYKAVSGSLGYVVSLGYFTKAEMKDPLWEYARVQNATMNWCQSESRYRRRDVRWLPSKADGDQQCAMVIYTVECLEPRNVPDTVDPEFNNHLEQTRSEMLSAQAPLELDSGCRPKERRVKTVSR
jgi:hypothetical protein